MMIENCLETRTIICLGKNVMIHLRIKLGIERRKEEQQGGFCKLTQHFIHRESTLISPFSRKKKIEMKCGPDE